MHLAYLFSGQGAQYPGMMRDLYEAQDAVKKFMRQADCATGRSISGLCFEGTQEELNLTHNTQPCVLAADLAAAVALGSYGVEPEAVAGFSLGEYAALVTAGALSVEDAFRTVQLRADAMQAAVPPGEGAMAAIVGGEAERVERICERVTSGYVVAANYNSPVQTVVSGAAAAVDEACRLAGEEGLRAMRLAVSEPFHCALMEPAAQALREAFKQVTFSEPHCPIYMNVDGLPQVQAQGIPDKLVRQAASPVRWVQTLEAMRESGIDTFIECGPGRTLSGLVRKTLPGVTALRVENMSTLEDVIERLG